MKRIISFIVISTSLLLNNCSTETPLSPDLQKGGISLNIDRAHKPANVVDVTAYLTREGFDTISGTLNLLSDTTADLTFNDLAAGQWHLKVDAADEDNTVVYAGETDVNILAGITTQVYLTLEPTGAGTGNIYIYVNWGVPANTDWIDYPGNPIMTPSIIPDYPNGISESCVLFDNGMYKMWFMATYNSAVANIWYAVSNDGINWQLGNNYPVLTTGNAWDSHTVGSGRVIKDDNGYKMYYGGFADEYGEWNIGLATSSDGINWTKHENPVIYADYDEFQIIPGDIIIIDGIYYLYYTVRNFPYYHISLATSPDGIVFTKSNNNPILSVTENWEGSGVLYPSIIFDNGNYKLIYGCYPAVGFGMAYSNDGINWTKDTNNPFFRLQNVTNNWCYAITYPFWRKFNNQYRIYYTGNTDGGYAESKIGFIYR